MIYYFHNEYHLGDNVFNLIFFNNIRSYIKKLNIYIYYYCQPQYMDQLVEFINNNNVVLFPIHNKPENSLQLWIENPQINYTFTSVKDKSEDKRVCYNIFYKNFFNIVLSKLKIKFMFTHFYYIDSDLITRYNNLNEKYKNIDILILNSQPFSEQYDYNKNEWDNYICELNKKYNIVTTTKVNNDIKCTIDDNLTIKTIAAISTKVPVIIAVNSGVVPGLLNIYTLTNVKQVFTFDSRCYYSYPNFVSKNKITDITFDILNNFINEKIIVNENEKIIVNENINVNVTENMSVNENVTENITEIINLNENINENTSVNENVKFKLSKKHNDFDWEVYLYFNKDLLIDKNLHSAKSLAWKHFIKYGINENRIYKFDWIKYIKENNLSLVVKNKLEVLNHISENNNLQKYLNIDSNKNKIKLNYKLFDWEFYVNKYSDLSHLNNHKEAFDHYVNYGEKEKREFSDFNWMDYLLINRDLINDGINTETKAVNHWLENGKSENRSYKL